MDVRETQDAPRLLDLSRAGVQSNGDGLWREVTVEA